MNRTAASSEFTEELLLSPQSLGLRAEYMLEDRMLFPDPVVIAQKTFFFRNVLRRADRLDNEVLQYLQAYFVRVCMSDHS